MSQTMIDLLLENRGKSVSASFNRPGDTTAYAQFDAVGPSSASYLTFSNLLPDLGVSPGERLFQIRGARLRLDTGTLPSGMAGFRLHLYSAAPTALADNALYNLPAADRAKYLGFLTLSTPLDLGDTLVACDDNLTFTGRCAAGSNTVYGILQTLAAYTPVASLAHTVTLNVAGA